MQYTQSVNAEFFLSYLIVILKWNRHFIADAIINVFSNDVEVDQKIFLLISKTDI